MGDGNSNQGPHGAARTGRTKKPLYLLLALVVLIMVVFAILHVFGQRLGVQI